MENVVVVITEEVRSREKRLAELEPILTEAQRLREEIVALQETLAVLTHPMKPERKANKRLTPMVLQILKSSPLPMTPSQIAEACVTFGFHTTNASVGVILNRYLKQAGAPVKRLTHGFYQYVRTEAD